MSEHMKIIRPDDEEARLEALEQYRILDTLPEQAYDDITFLAAQITGTPIALVSLVDRTRQWFKSKVGLDASETPREQAFCQHAILKPRDLLIVPDARQDDRFAENPLVTAAPNIRFYAGAPLVTPKGAALGTLCVIDHKPRELSDAEQLSIRALSRQVVAQLELRRVVDELSNNIAARERYQRQLEEYQRQLETTNAELQERSVTDKLTGVRNRRAFEQRLDEELARASRHEAPLSLALLDVDRFKSFNDEHGHLEGDDVLRMVARLLEANSRSSDLVARYGGEEFVVILPNTTRHGAYILAERFRQAIERAPWERRAITVCVGVSTLGADASDAAALIAAADRALYYGKENGRNQVAHVGSLDAEPEAVSCDDVEEAHSP